MGGWKYGEVVYIYLAYILIKDTNRRPDAATLKGHILRHTIWYYKYVRKFEMEDSDHLESFFGGSCPSRSSSLLNSLIAISSSWSNILNLHQHFCTIEE